MFLIRQRDVAWINHYLDDYVLVGPPGPQACANGLHRALVTFRDTGFPVSEAKTVSPSSMIILLRIEFDTHHFELCLPLEKLDKLKVLLKSWRSWKVCSERELQSLAGHLGHSYKVVRASRCFLRSLFELLSNFRLKDGKIHLNTSFRSGGGSLSNCGTGFPSFGNP